ncbi:MAG: hypothetical protein FWG50_01600 [Kiritimatiellaeota bacterium]|nr:hypothetical protein [Kiritimatiellota bacterium]
MRRVLGITLLAIRASLRTKAVVALFALLAVCVLLLPSVIKSDGTAEGSCRILLMYTVGFSFGILCLSTLWAACALFAAEIDSLRIQLSAVKPVRAAEFWLGKWLALLLLNAFLLAAVYGGVYAQLRWQMRANGWGEQIALTSRTVARPILPSVAQEVRETYALLKARDNLPEGMSERAILRALAQNAQERYDLINPGEEKHWRFTLARPLRTGEAITVRIRFDTEFSTRTAVQGFCRLSSGDRAVEVPLDDFSLNEIEFEIAAEAFGAADAFTLSFRHTGDPQESSALMLRFRQDVALLTAGGTFEANLARSALIQWSVLALLAAFGLTLSTGFSMPVAMFTATVLLVLTIVGQSVVEGTSHEDEQEWSNRPGIWVSRGVTTLTQHATQNAPLESVIRGERVDAKALRAALLWNVLLTPALFALLGTHILRRRELAG